MDDYKELSEFFNELKQYREILTNPDSKLLKSLVEEKRKSNNLTAFPFLEPLFSTKSEDELKEEVKEEIRERLVRKRGTLKDKIIKLTGHQDFNLFKSTYDMWSEALSTVAHPEVTRCALSLCIDATNEAIGKVEKQQKEGEENLLTELFEKPAKVSKQPSRKTVESPKAFIAHGGQSQALDILKNFLTSIGVEPLIVEEQASKNRSIGNNVDWYARQADCAIILATKGDIDGVTGGFIPRGNVLMEIGKAQELFKDRIIYLLQAGTKFPTNVSEKVWGRFTSSCMDEALTKVARELTEFGILKTVKPQKGVNLETI